MIEKPKKLTKKSGVYLFKNKEQEIIYIGKAKNIADRIASYFNLPSDYKTTLLLQEAITLETIPTSSEVEALYLEVELIKKYQPKFNRLLKEGNPFVYLFFSQEKIPTLSIVRIKGKKKGVYIGPFLTKKAAYSVFKFLVNTLQLRFCNKKIAQGCLQYHIGLCAGSCMTDFDIEFYKFRLLLAEQLLTNQSDDALKAIEKEMKEAIKNLQYERARSLLEYKQNFEEITQTLQALQLMPSKQKVPDTQKNLGILMALQKRLHLKHVPYVIDCFDISHMQSLAIVGSCIRYVHGVPEPKSFRRFKIKTIVQQDDYAAMAEIVRRRYRSGLEYPNLVIVDGGKGQITAVKPYIGTAELVGLAKKEETIISSDFKHFIQLDPQRPEDLLLLQIRDKTHQFAISYHRKKRSMDSQI
ncbi:MAG TPA: GIY-YIG nuclease family protein [Candidatus Saccharimonadales bacterium]|nr:GIY-YIG nuclease family protein [Candidatus Saccharimonadales bacterium]